MAEKVNWKQIEQDILGHLSDGPKTITQLTEATGHSRSRVTDRVHELLGRGETHQQIEPAGFAEDGRSKLYKVKGT